MSRATSVVLYATAWSSDLGKTARVCPYVAYWRLHGFDLSSGRSGLWMLRTPGRMPGSYRIYHADQSHEGSLVRFYSLLPSQHKKKNSRGVNGWLVCLKSRGHRLTVRFLETGTGASSSVLFRFAATRITDQHVAVVLHERLSQFVLGLFVHVLGVVGHDGFGNGRPNGVNLRRNTTALDTDADVDIAKFLLSYNQASLPAKQ